MKRNEKQSFTVVRAAFAVIAVAIAALCMSIVFSASCEGTDDPALSEDDISPAPIQTAWEFRPLQDGSTEMPMQKVVPAIRKPICHSEVLCASTEVPADNPYAALDLTLEEKELLACMAYCEARGEPFEGQVAVIQVALNRYMHDAYSGTLSDILLAPYQFAVGDTYSLQQMDAVEEALSGYPALDLNTDVVYFSTGGLTYGSYHSTIGGHVFRTHQ